MTVKENIYKLRSTLGLSQAAFAEKIDVSQQTVQKWESGESLPTLDKVTLIAQRFGVSLDSLILDREIRSKEELASHAVILPKYSGIPEWELYSENLLTEYKQSVEEGLDIGEYQGLFESVAKLPRSDYKAKLSDVLFRIVTEAKQKEGYPYREPSTWKAIKALRPPYAYTAKKLSSDVLKDKIAGAWYGRICGCLLGKSVEGVKTTELVPFLKMTGNYPLSRYIRRADFKDEDVKQFRFDFPHRAFADTCEKMPWDDDTNYTVLYQELIERYGADFTAEDVLPFWIGMQAKYSYCTAERVAFCNAIRGYAAPDTAIYENPFREWIGAQIRADYFGYINPGDPERAAEMAFRDASVSHTKNGIYGEMFVAAMIAAAACLDDVSEVIRAGLAQIPASSRLYEGVTEVMRGFEAGVSVKDCFRKIHENYDEMIAHHWCHTVSNALIVTAALLYGGNDYGRSVCLAVETGFDTDCNGATVGSILGMKNGRRSIGDEWTSPLHDTLETTLHGVGTVKISDRVEMTLDHIRKYSAKAIG